MLKKDNKLHSKLQWLYVFEAFHCYTFLESLAAFMNLIKDKVSLLRTGQRTENTRNYPLVSMNISTPNFMGIWPIVVGNILIWTKLSDRWMNTHTSRSTGPTQWYLLICLKNNSVCSSICPAKNGRELKKGYRVDTYLQIRGTCSLLYFRFSHFTPLQFRGTYIVLRFTPLHLSDILSYSTDYNFPVKWKPCISTFGDLDCDKKKQKTISVSLWGWENSLTSTSAK